MNEREKIAHLLRRFGLGASEAEMEYYGKNGHAGAIQLLLDFAKLPEPTPLEPEKFANQNGQLNPRAAQVHLYSELLTTVRPLEAKLTLFWHNHFAVSAEKVDSGDAMAAHYRLLKANCAGSFKDLIHATSKDPAMLYWLDNQLNVVGRPNENFAREVLELFTVGIGHYSEVDVKEAARAFTGWRYGRKRGNRVVTTDQVPRGRGFEFTFIAREHDDGQKSFMGSTAPFNGDDILDVLCANRQTSLHLVKKFWEWFAYPNPSDELVARGAEVWRRSRLDILALTRWVMESPEFYSAKAERAVVKNPVDFVIPAARQLGIGGLMARQIAEGVEIRRAAAFSIGAQRACKAMGMDLLYPPDVSGWATGKGWISTATVVERIKLADTLFNPRNAGPLVAALFAADRSPEGIVNKLVSLFDARLPEAKMKQLVEGAAAQDGNLPRAANQVTRLIMGSPEFQFC